MCSQGDVENAKLRYVGIFKSLRVDAAYLAFYKRIIEILL